jgi:hypothetical protein
MFAIFSNKTKAQIIHLILCAIRIHFFIDRKRSVKHPYPWKECPVCGKTVEDREAEKLAPTARQSVVQTAPVTDDEIPVATVTEKHQDVGDPWAGGGEQG